MEETNTAKHILLIDDDPLMLRVFSASLNKAGFQVVQAHNGPDGREMARRLQPDLILLDLRMPGMDGTEFIGRIKEEDVTKNIPVVIFSNEDLSLEAVQAMKDLGAEDYIYKSMPVDEMVTRLREILGIAAEEETPAA